MKRQSSDWILLSVLVVLSLMLSACSGAGQPAQATMVGAGQPAAGGAAASEAPPAASEAPAATQAPAPATQAPA
ncbi:MAG: ammonia channel protein, partial [Chloroflexota bacterium]